MLAAWSSSADRARVSCCLFFLLAALAAMAGPARAFSISTFMEAVRVPSVGATFVTVNFENTYTNPVAVCTHNLVSSANPPATVRMRSLGATSMEIRLQQMPASNAVTAAPVHCLIVEEGAHTLPDGRALEARSVTSTFTNGQNSVHGWNQANTNNVTGLVTGTYANPIVLGQVMTFNDTNASSFYGSDCDARGNPPFLSGMADGICVSKQIGQLAGSRADEEVGFIVTSAGAGIAGDVAYQAARGADSVAGVGNAPPYAYGAGRDFTVGVATQVGMDGNQGGWAVLYGADPLPNGQILLAIDEEVAAGDTTRRHTTENVDWWAFKLVPETDVTKDVDQTEIAEARTLNYTITADNIGRIDQTGVTAVDTLPDGSNGTLTGPIESFAGGTAGVLEVGETWTWTISYAATAADITAGSPLVNTIAVSSAEHTADGLADETDTATTIIVPQTPGLTIAKTFAFTTGSAPASVGDVIEYTYTVENTGNVTIDNVQVADDHDGTGPFPANPDHASLVDNAPTGDSPDTNGDATIWGALGPGDVVTFSASYTVNQTDVDTLQ